jgi:hypothetical protein
MQTGLELAIMANIASAIVSLGVVVFLLRHWLRLQVRLYTDLPLLFAIMFSSLAFNTTLQALTLSGMIENTLAVFRLRALIIMGSALPLLAALLVIWLAKYQKYHKRIMIVAIALWFSIALISPTETLILLLLIPPLLVFDLGMVVTFAVTWKTGRLKEVRSDLMIVSLLIGFVSQVIKVQFQAADLDWIPISIAAMSGVLAAIALSNPWFYRKNGRGVVDEDQLEYVYTVGA